MARDRHRKSRFCSLILRYSSLNVDNSRTLVDAIIGLGTLRSSSSGTSHRVFFSCVISFVLSISHLPYLTPTATIPTRERLSIEIRQRTKMIDLPSTRCRYPFHHLRLNLPLSHYRNLQTTSTHLVLSSPSLHSIQLVVVLQPVSINHLLSVPQQHLPLILSLPSRSVIDDRSVMFCYVDRRNVTRRCER